jgi:hypothetical protein
MPCLSGKWNSLRTASPKHIEPSPPSNSFAKSGGASYAFALLFQIGESLDKGQGILKSKKMVRAFFSQIKRFFAREVILK